MLSPMMEWDFEEMGRPWKRDPFLRGKGSLSQTHPPQELSHHAPSYDGMGFERDGKTLEERPLSTEKGVSLPNPLSTKAVPTTLRPR